MLARRLTYLIGASLLTVGCTEVVEPRECAAPSDCVRFGGEADDWACTGGRCEALERCDGDDACGRGRFCLEGDCIPLDDAPDSGGDIGDDTGPTSPARTVVEGRLGPDAVWSPDAIPVLNGNVVVSGQLTIEPGTRIEARPGSALVVPPGAELLANGTAQSPVVFTSSAASGRRTPGSWRGIVMLGRAPTNDPTVALDGLDESGAFGGTDLGYRCGVLQYVRVEFAGGAPRSEGAGAVTLAGCGSRTLIDHVQAHRPKNHGFSILGGTVNAKHLVATRAGLAGVDWSLGWTGRVQFVIIQMDPTGDNALAGANLVDNHDARPRSAPTFFNVTVLGPVQGQARGADLRGGTAGTLSNAVVVGTSGGVLDVADFATATQWNEGNLVVEHSLFPSDAAFPVEDTVSTNDDAPDLDDDGVAERDVDCSIDDEMAVCGGFQCVGGRCGFDESRTLRDPRLSNRFAASPYPTVPELVAPESADPRWTPAWVPTGEATARLTDVPAPTGPFWEDAPYIGAFAPGDDASNWAAGWTDFPDK